MTSKEMSTKALKNKINRLRSEMETEYKTSGRTKRFMFLEATVEVYTDELGHRDSKLVEKIRAEIIELGRELEAERKANGSSNRALFLAYTINARTADLERVSRL